MNWYQQMDRYTQCHLVRHLEDGIAMTTSFIPTEFAQKGRTVKLKDGDKWIDGWVVASVGETVSQLEHVPSLIREHRKNTKDSMKKLDKKA